MGLNAGSLVYLVTIQKLADGVDTSGAPTEIPSTLGTAWMARETVSGMERFATNQLSASAVVRWTMRYRSDMDPDIVNVAKTRRLVYQSRTYDITEAESDKKQNWIAVTTLVNSAVAA